MSLELYRYSARSPDPTSLIFSQYLIGCLFGLSHGNDLLELIFCRTSSGAGNT